MRWVLGLLFGVTLGGLMGWAVEQTPLRPWLQSLISILLSSLIIGWATFLFLWSRARAAGEAGYFGFGTENLALLAGLGAIGLVLHVLFGYVGRWFAIADVHRAALLGAAAGGYAASSAQWVIHASRELLIP